MEKSVELRCPITFVGDKIENSQELNTMFLEPYEISMVSGMQHIATEDDIRKSMFDNNNNEDMIIRGTKFTSAMVEILNNNITSYLIMNITDLTINTVIKFIQSEFSNNPNNITSFINGVDQTYIRNEVISATVDALSTINPLASIMQESITALASDYDKAMDIIFARISALVFDTLITGTVEMHYKAGNIIELYKTLYKDCYGTDNNIDKKLDDPAFMYTFVTSCLREDCQKLLIDYRKALTLIATTAASMRNTSPIQYCNPNNYLNPEYTKENIYKETPDMNLIYQLNKSIDSKEEE